MIDNCEQTSENIFFPGEGGKVCDVKGENTRKIQVEVWRSLVSAVTHTH